MPDLQKKATLRVRANLLREIVAGEKTLEKKFAARVEVMQRKLRGLAGSKVPKAVENEMRKLVKEITPTIKKQIRQGIGAGAETAQEQFKALFPEQAKELLPEMLTTREAMELGGRRLRGKLYVDKVPLSNRIWSDASAQGAKMAAKIQGTLRAGNGMEAIAKEIVRTQPPFVKMPNYIARLAEAAQQAKELGQPNILEEAVAKYKSQVDKLGSSAGSLFDSYKNTQRFISDIRGATSAQIGEHVARYMGEKARQHAVMIARTETIHAYRDGYYKSLEGQEWVKGIRWNLSGSHPEVDECDILAGQDLHGLGAGGYPPGDYPGNPHPNCMCYQSSIADRDHFKRKLAKLKGEKPPPEKWKSGKKETGAQWLAKQPEAKQRGILGPTRTAALKISPDAVVSPKTGVITLVRDLPAKLRRTPTRSPKKAPRKLPKTPKKVAPPPKPRKKVAPPKPRKEGRLQKLRREADAKLSPAERAARVKAATKRREEKFASGQAKAAEKYAAETKGLSKQQIDAGLINSKSGFQPWNRKGKKSQSIAMVKANVDRLARGEGSRGAGGADFGVGKMRPTAKPELAYGHLTTKGYRLKTLKPLPLPIRPPDPHAALLSKKVKGFTKKKLPTYEFNTGYPPNGPLKSGMTLKEAETALTAVNREHMAAWDHQGNLIFRKTVGDAYQVGYTRAEGEFLRKHAAYATHNHPGGGSFSIGDMKGTINGNKHEFRALASKQYNGPGSYNDGTRAPIGSVYSVKQKSANKRTIESRAAFSVDADRAYDRARDLKRSGAKRRSQGEKLDPPKHIERSLSSYDDALTDTWNEMGKTYGFNVEFQSAAGRLAE